jgi:hypothetical protein
MSTTYSALFSENMILGKWLQQKPVMVTINDMLFVHAGISNEFIERGYTRSQTNKLFHQNILGKNWDTILKDSVLTFMTSDHGPVWHRQYFTHRFSESQIDHQLRYFNINHIIVGHTSLPNIVSLYGGKVYGIDSSIKIGNYGEVFIYRDGRYYRGTSMGTLLMF